MIKSFDQYKETYFPLRTEADKVKQMNSKAYIDWFINTPVRHRDKILAILKNDKEIASV